MIRRLSYIMQAGMPLIVQLALLLIGFTFVLLAPPAHGAILLVPLSRDARAHVAALAVERGALLIGRGRFEGSLIVRGDRNLLGGALLRRGILPITAPEISCGVLAGEGQPA